MQKIQTLLNEGKGIEAKKLCDQALKQDPHNPRLWHLSAMVAYYLQDYATARTQIEKAIPSLKNDPAVHLNHALIEFALENYDAAIKHALHAQKIDPNNLTAYINLGYMYLQLKQYQQAIDTYNLGIEHIQPTTNKKNSAALYYNLGVTFKEAGLVLPAIKAYEQALQYLPNHQSAMLNLGQIYKERYYLDRCKTLMKKLIANKSPLRLKALYHLSDCKLSDEEIQQAIKALAQIDKIRLNSEEQIRYDFTQACLLHKSKQYEKAWKIYSHVNEVLSRTHQFKYQAFINECEHIKKYFTQHAFSDLPKGNDSTQPVFVIGLPRSGKTLCEQLLRHHEDISGIGEGTYFIQQVDAWKHATQNNLALAFTDFDASKLDKLGKLYLQYTEFKAHDKCQFVLDTMPYHGMFMGFLQQVFPNAKFILIKRNRADTICKLFFKWFEVGHEYSYSLEWCDQFYTLYYDMLAFWESWLPKDNILTINFELLITDTVDTLNYITDFLGLPKDKKPNWLPKGEHHLDMSELDFSAPYKEWLEK